MAHARRGSSGSHVVDALTQQRPVVPPFRGPLPCPAGLPGALQTGRLDLRHSGPRLRDRRESLPVLAGHGVARRRGSFLGRLPVLEEQGDVRNLSHVRNLRRTADRHRGVAVDHVLPVV